MNTVLRLDGTTVVESRILPTIIENHFCADVIRLREVTSEDWRLYEEPVINPYVNKVGDYVINEIITREILLLDSTELANIQEIMVENISAGARNLIEHEIDAAGMILVDRMLRANPLQEKALATEQWINNIYMEAERRKSLVRANMYPNDIIWDPPDPTDFSRFGSKPYTIAQLWAEA